MHRRDLLRTLAATALAGAIPRSLAAQTIWTEALERTARPAHSRLFGPAERALVHAIADVILPRTDTPSASDVQVADFVELIVERHDDATARQAFLDGLGAIEALAQRTANQALVAMPAAQREALIARLDAATPRTTPAERTYGRLKGLVIHAYFTHERVQRDVLRTEIVPGRFEGDAPHVVPPVPGGTDAR